MEDFTRNITLRALSVSDFVKAQERESHNYIDATYKLSDDFEVEGVLEVYSHCNCDHNHKGMNTFWLTYETDEDIVYRTDADTFEDVIEAFNDWRMKMYSDLLFLPDNKTITIKMTGYTNNF
jgi:hypothetical protein